MSNKPSRIHLERNEFFVICGIVFLFAGLMFSLGVMVGAGLNPSTEVAAHDEHEADENDHADSHDGHGKKEVSRKIASAHGPSKKSAQHANDEKGASGKNLKDSYRKAKQAEFEEMLSNDDGQDVGPSSVMDSQAYFDSRESKREEDKDLPLETNFSGMRDERKPAAVNTKKQKVPPVVKNLFERRPAAANDYSPVYGEYTVLVASFSSQDEAVSKLGALRVAGFDDAYFRKEKSKDGSSEWYRVGIGSYKDLRWALKAKETLKKKSLSATPIVRKVDY